jgi:hypothetical protein
LIATFILTTFPLLPLFLPTISTTLLLPSLLTIVLFLNLSGSYFQSAALALASMWGPAEILAALSGQGGVAVLISLVQVILAIIGVLGANQPAGDEKPSMLAGVGLWGLGSIAAGLCWLAFRFLISHPAYERIVGSGSINAVGVDSGKKGNWDRSMVVLRKNKLLYLAVALDFAVTLVGRLEYTRGGYANNSVGIPSDHILDRIHTQPHPSTPTSRCIHPVSLFHLQWYVFVRCGPPTSSIHPYITHIIPDPSLQ